MCTQVADTGVSAILLEQLIISRGNFSGIYEWDVQLTKRQNVPATTAINTAATTVTTTITLTLQLLLLLPMQLF